MSRFDRIDVMWEMWEKVINGINDFPIAVLENNSNCSNLVKTVWFYAETNLAKPYLPLHFNLQKTSFAVPYLLVQKLPELWNSILSACS